MAEAFIILAYPLCAHIHNDGAKFILSFQYGSEAEKMIKKECCMVAFGHHTISWFIMIRKNHKECLAYTFPPHLPVQVQGGF